MIYLFDFQHKFQRKIRINPVEMSTAPATVDPHIQFYHNQAKKRNPTIRTVLIPN